MVKFTQVQRIEYVSRNQFEYDVQNLNQPIIITNAINHWQAIKEWNFSFFKEKYSSEPVFCEMGELFECTTVSQSGRITDAKRIKMELGSFIDSIFNNNSEKLYLTEWKIFEQIPEVERFIDFKQPDIYTRVFVAPIRMYMSNSNSFTPIHFDHAPNITAQLVGSKRWTFFSPDQIKFLDFYPWYSQLSHFSRVNSINLMHNFDKFPKLKHLNFVDCILQKGELLYVPEKWPHCVYSLEPSISLNFFWKPLPLFLKQVLSFPFRIMAGTTYASTTRIKYSNIFQLISRKWL